ncbi:hypothetical protein DF057_01255 [Burkholderia cepacia]|uniref:hypothetical protein n=1 Tax=Burkholderia cepacia TaxID=292 RepID=UPI000F5FFCFE|nr:hypothetical protein [Burkholderia cepacia]RQZ64401.1 hypothetical protein DF057_01255 [Burkholderia cepacia]
MCPGGSAGSTSTGRPENRDDNAQRTQATPMARLGESPPRRENDDAAVLAAARFITGQAIAVDGGFIV